MAELSKYEKERDRVTRFNNKKNMSDKEIIEFLSEEIDQYRNRIKQQNKIIDELSKKTIKSEENLLETYDEKCIVTRWYEDGMLMKEEIKPCEQLEKQDTCPPIIPELRAGL